MAWHPWGTLSNPTDREGASDLEPEGSYFVVTPSKAAEEAGTRKKTGKEVPIDRGYKAIVNEVHEEDEDIGEIHSSTPLITIIDPLSPFLHEVMYMLPSPVCPKSSSSHYRARYQLKRSITPRALLEIQASCQLKVKTHPFLVDLQPLPSYEIILWPSIGYWEWYLCWLFCNTGPIH